MWTSDIPVASRCHKKRARVVSPIGRAFEAASLQPTRSIFPAQRSAYYTWAMPKLEKRDPVCSRPAARPRREAYSAASLIGAGLPLPAGSKNRLSGSPVK
jgi:hypothetical protein